MSKSIQTPAAHRRLLNAMLSEVVLQFCTAHAAQGKSEANNELLTLLAMAKLFDVTCAAVYEEKFNLSPREYDYCPKIQQPSFDEIQLRMDALQRHLENLGTSEAFFTRPWLGGLLRLSANLVGAIDWLAGEAEPVELGSAIATAMENATADLSHRLSPIGDTGNTLAMVDSVNMMGSKAEAVLTMLGNTFAEDEDTARPSDDAVFYALRSIGDEIADIKATVNAFHRQVKNHHA